MGDGRTFLGAQRVALVFEGFWWQYIGIKMGNLAGRQLLVILKNALGFARILIAST